MLEIFDKNRKRIAVAENAHSVSEERRINSIWYLTFALPYDDSKNEYCQPFNLVRYDGGELYRIMPSDTAVSETGTIEYQCEHVLATLLDNVLFGYHVVGNRGVYTRDCINYVLGKQLTQNWVLGECDFARQFEYGWEQETLLSALFSIATPLTNYMWVTDTSRYPWRLSLKAIDMGQNPELYIQYSRNMLSFSSSKDPQQVCTRLYPLGYGEGVNQLTIKGVNNGVPYLQSPQAYIDQFGIVERVWIDRRYEDPESLKAAAQVMLDELQEPIRQYEISFSELDASDYSKAEIGKRTRILHPELGVKVDTYITELKYDHENITNSTLIVANRSTDIASSVADMADRQRIEQAYAQGATQLYAQTLQANCDKESGAIMNFFIPEDMRIINKVLAKVRLSSFRSYSRATTVEKANVITSTASETEVYSSSAGGGVSSTTGDGGGTYTSTSTSGRKTVTATAVVLSAENIWPTEAALYNAAKHNHGIADRAKLALYDTDDEGKPCVGGYVDFIESGAHSHGEHDHDITIPGHDHDVEIDDHWHDIDIPSHSHSIRIPGHDHDVEIPAHDHEITPGIFFSGNPKSFTLYVNDQKKASFQSTDEEIDLTEYLVDEDSSLIPRGAWLTVEIRPNDLAYVCIDMYVQGFVQSRGDATV